jgi:hypothetical protein
MNLSFHGPTYECRSIYKFHIISYSHLYSSYIIHIYILYSNSILLTSIPIWRYTKLRGGKTQCCLLQALRILCSDRLPLSEKNVKKTEKCCIWGSHMGRYEKLCLLQVSRWFLAFLISLPWKWRHERTKRRNVPKDITLLEQCWLSTKEKYICAI